MTRFDQFVFIGGHVTTYRNGFKAWAMDAVLDRLCGDWIDIVFHWPSWPFEDLHISRGKWGL